MPRHRFIRSHWFASALILAAFCAPTLVQATPQPSLRIYRYAAFDAQQIANKYFTTLPGSSAQQRIQLSVYGKQLTLRLGYNTGLTKDLPAQHNGIVLLRGTLEGQPDSWVRLTKTRAGSHGLIWDGAELYVIEPSAEIRGALAVSLPAPSSETVIFKLSDTTIDLGADSCGSHQSNTANAESGLATYQAIRSELSAQAVSANGEPSLLLELQTLADAAFRAQYSSDQTALDAIMVRLNNIDGIFSTQAGLRIHAANVTVFSQDLAALSASSNADTLLSSLGQLRDSDPDMRRYAATHLFTGRDLDGDTMGIAYIGNICDARYGSSLSELRDRGAWIDSLVAAHELGHQLGAVHDGTGVCGGTAPQSYLMGIQINGNSELSQCSLDSIFATMQHAACLIPVGAPDLTIANNNPQLQVTPGTPFNWTLPIQNLGTGTASVVSVQMLFPIAVTIDAAAIVGGSCITSTGNIDTQVNCQFDNLVAFETRALELTLHSDVIGAYTVSASVSTTNDDNPNNNSTAFNLAVGGATSTATATPEPTSSGGGGGAMNLAWLWMAVSLAGLRHALVRRQRRSQPLH